MPPMIDKKKIVGLAMERLGRPQMNAEDKTKRLSVGLNISMGRSGQPEDEKTVLAEDLIQAIDRKDAAAVASAFSALYQACELEPHEEYGEERDLGDEYENDD